MERFHLEIELEDDDVRRVQAVLIANDMTMKQFTEYVRLQKLMLEMTCCLPTIIGWPPTTFQTYNDDDDMNNELKNIKFHSPRSLSKIFEYFEAIECAS